MEQAKHTPGPWSYRYWSNCSDNNLLEGYSISADGHIVPMNTAEGDLYEAESNARLISAAPELLDALQKLLERISYYASLAGEDAPNIEQWEYTDGSSDVATARAAIVKALGE